MSLTDKINSYSLSHLHDYAQVMLHSSCEDYIDIRELTQNIKDNFLNWVKSSILLDAVRKEFRFLVLKEKMAKNWGEYCKKLIGKSHWQVNNIIKAGQVVLILFKNGFTTLPDCEAQARPLTKFLPDYEQMNSEEIAIMEKEVCDLWQKVVEFSEDKIITANMVNSVVNPESAVKENTSIRIDNDTYEKLDKLAKNSGYDNVTDYLKAIANNQVNLQTEDTREEVPEEKIKVWEEDLEQLVKEHEEELKQQTKQSKLNDSNILDSCEDVIKQFDNYFSKYWQLDIFGNRQVHNTGSA